MRKSPRYDAAPISTAQGLSRLPVDCVKSAHHTGTMWEDYTVTTITGITPDLYLRPQKRGGALRSGVHRTFISQFILKSRSRACESDVTLKL